MVDRLAEQPQKFTDFDDAFSYLTRYTRLVNTKDNDLIAISPIARIKTTQVSPFECVVIYHRTEEGIHEYVVNAPDSPQPGLAIERFDPQKTVRSLSGRLFTVNLGERQHIGYYEDNFLHSHEPEDLPTYQELRKEAGRIVAENIRRLIES